MKEVLLETKPRTAMGTRAARRLRDEGLVPLTLNAKRETSLHLQAAARELSLVLKTGARILTLVHPKGKDRVFLKEVQYDHLGERVYHVDFTKIAMNETLQLEVVLVLKGKPIGVLEEEGVLDQYIKMVKIACLPDAIPEKIEADVSGLKMNEHLTIANLAAPQGVKLLQDPELVLAAVTEHVLEEVAPVAAEVGPLEPEVIKKEKSEEEEEAEEGGKKEKAGKEPEAAKVKEKEKDKK